MLARNSIANYVGQGYTILVAIVVTPTFLGILGLEEFDLIHFDQCGMPTSEMCILTVAGWAIELLIIWPI